MPRQTLAWRIIHQQFRIAQNGRKHVIKIVRDAPSESAQGVHFMALTHLCLALMPFGNVETGHEHGWQALPGHRGQADLEPEGALILAYALYDVTLWGRRSLQTGVAIPLPGGMLVRRQKRAHIAATQVIRTGIAKESDHDGIDKLNNAVPVEHAYPLQRASHEITIVLFVPMRRFLYVSVFESLARRDATVSSNLLRLGIRERRGGGCMGFQRRGIEHHSNGPSIGSTARRTRSILHHDAPGKL